MSVFPQRYRPCALWRVTRLFLTCTLLTITLAGTAAAQGVSVYVVAAADLQPAPGGKVTYSPAPNESVTLTLGTNVFTSFEAAMAVVNAVTATNAVSQISIGAGTFDIGVPQVTINKPVNIVGRGPATVLRASVSTPAATGDGRALILVGRSVFVHFSQLTIDGHAPTPIGTTPTIAVRDAIRFSETGTATSLFSFNYIDHVAFRNIRAGNPGTGDFDGIGIDIRYGSVNVTNCTFDNIGYVGTAYVDGDSLDLAYVTGQYTGNTYTGKGAGNTLDYGIRVNGATSVTIQGNTFTNALGQSSSDSRNSAGIHIYQDTSTSEPIPNAQIANNSFINDREGIIVGIPGQTGDYEGATIVANNFIGPFGDTFAIFSTRTIATITASNNYWGSAAGPFNAANNPTGDPSVQVSDIVMPIAPFAATPFAVTYAPDNTAIVSLNGTISGTVTRATYGTLLAGVTVYLDYNVNNTLDEGEITTTTDATGHYAFTNLTISQTGAFQALQVLPPAPLRPPAMQMLASIIPPSSSTTVDFQVLGGLTTTTAIVGPNPANVGSTVILGASVSPTNATGTMTFQIDGATVSTGSLVGGTATMTTSNLTAGTHTVTVAYGGDPTYATSTSTIPLIVVNDSVGLFKQYFAEGATGNFFHTSLGILNASDTEDAHLRITLYPEAAGATPYVTLMTLDPLTRRTLDLNALLGNVSGVSTLVESDQPVAATREMTWGSPVYGSTLESGAATPSTSWYFAEGATNVFSLFYLVENPNATVANLTLTHLPEGGGAPVVTTDTVPAFSRRTFFINDVPGLQSASLSTVITADQPIVAERAMYLNMNPGGRLWEGGTAGHGATALNTTWSFAEGATGFFHTYLLFGNPGTDAPTVTVTYQLPDGTKITKSYDVAAQSRRTVDVGGEDPLLAATSVGMSVASTKPIVSERAMWWGDPWTDGSASLGSTETGTVWAIGGGTEGGPDAASTYILIANSSATPGTIRLTVVNDDGTRQQKDYPLLANARLTVHIADDFAQARNARFSVVVESLNPTVPITVETAQYQSGNGLFNAGGAALATKVR